MTIFLITLVVIILSLMLVGSLLTPWWASSALGGITAAVAAIVSGLGSALVAVVSAGIGMLGAALGVIIALPIALAAVLFGLLPLLIPLAVVAGLVWLIVRAGNASSAAVARPVPVAALPPPA